MLDILSINRGSTPASLFRNLGARTTARRAAADGQLDRDPSGRAEPQPQRGRRRISPSRPARARRCARSQVGGGDASGHAGWVHVGLGTAERAEIRVQWPDGEQSYPYRVFANQFVVVDRTKQQAEYWYPAR